jgi:glycosyltransferase involved in cell wall biosynthesis
MTGWIPWRWRAGVRNLLEEPKKRRWMNARKTMGLTPAGDSVVLDFGFEPGGQGFLHGGKVKLGHLRNHFPCDPVRANLLYIVSSALPDAAEDYVVWAKSRGAFLVWNQNGVAFPAWAGRESERYNRRMRGLRSLADHVVYQSEFCRSSAEQFLGSCSLPSTILLNPVDLERFCPANSKPPDHRPLRLLAAGTHGYPERVTSALVCLKTLRKMGVEASLTVAGRMVWPSAETFFARSLRSLDIEEWVDRKPVFSQDDAPLLYQAHDLLLHPKYMDPCPTVVAEALACGLPVVASASGGVPEMTNPQCACLIPSKNSYTQDETPSGEQMALAVRELSGRMEEASMAARKCAESQFRVDHWVEGHRKIFHEILGQLQP